MERKILWLISFILICIVWIKVEHSEPNQTSDTQVNKTTTPVVKEDEASPVKKPLAEEVTEVDDNDASEEEKKYYKSHPISGEAPNFAEIVDVKERKKAFFNFLKPYVDEKNQLILQDRKLLKTFLNNKRKLTANEVKWISALRKSLKLEVKESYSKADLNALLNRLDIIPVSLVLAQAANESAWGTSRFATMGNNYFGQWCFRKGCGLVPESRDDDADHEVRKFHDARESVFAYIDNLNRNAAYKSLRATRKTLRDNQESISGLALAEGLLSYSQRGEDYVDEIKGLIEYNKLWRFNHPSNPVTP
ncbi:glucosaminidase domain-containing protein [Marinomonas dokdonensis]|uniref:glucosaminidase domain-containing protein n=1 Tax=Marinomonas dokdonensis TaxID=328224 RepID=UPI0040556B2A